MAKQQKYAYYLDIKYSYIKIQRNFFAKKVQNLPQKNNEKILKEKATKTCLLHLIITINIYNMFKGYFTLNINNNVIQSFLYVYVIL